MLGDPVRRGPILSIRLLAVSITFELRNPSCRIRVTMSRSTRSCPGSTGTSVMDARRARDATLLKKPSCLTPRTLPPSRVRIPDFRFQVASPRCHPEVADAPEPLWRRRERSDEGSAFSREESRSFASVRMTEDEPTSVESGAWNLELRSLILFGEEEGQGEARVGLDPLLEGAEAGRRPHRQHLFRSVLVGTFGPDELAI